MVLDDICRRELKLERDELLEELLAFKAYMSIIKHTDFHLGFLLGELMGAINIIDDDDLHTGLLQDWKDSVSQLYKLEEL